MTCLYLYSFLLLSLSAPPDVVLLSVDTLRADYLGCYGYPQDSSPHLDQFAKGALVFEDCVCEVPLTNPSFGAMLSSLYPRTTGTTRNGLRMPDSVPLVPERFKAAGYQTLCVQSNWTLKGRLSGLDRGFDVYEDDFHQKRWGFMKAERLAEDVTDIALKLLAERDPARPLFAWIHYSDPHSPYRFNKDHNPLGKRPFWLDGTQKVRVKYASEVAYADYHIGRLLDALPQKNTAILFVADHGESLYEHDYLGHGRRIYHDNLHVPLMIRAAGVQPGRTSVPARVLDVGPTLLGLAGLPPLPGTRGANVLDAEMGVSNDLVPSRVRVVETYGGAVPKIPGAKAVMAGRAPIRQGVVVQGWKLILGGSGPELFSLPQDPYELDNLASDMPGKVAELARIIDAWDKRYGHAQGSEAALSKDDIKALESLGYLD